MNQLPVALPWIQALDTWFLVGLIWTIQVVHYPSLGDVSPADFPRFHAAHLRRISWLVGPPMLLEVAVVLALVAYGPAEQRGLALLGAFLLLGIWFVTALYSVPCHRRLERGFDAAAIRRLIRTNWIRTGLWSLRGVLALGFLPGFSWAG